MADQSESNSSMAPPECYYLAPTKHVPNSPLPLLVYRDVLPKPITAESCQEMVEGHGWTRQSKIWGAYYYRHFHPNNHECYAVLSGDVIIHPAGVSHANVSEEGDYKYMPFNPSEKTTWRTELGRKPMDFDAMIAETLAVPIPCDPVAGHNGHLQRLWSEALDQFQASASQSA
ncbi:unnamed protein product [Clonostachys rosea]|uniref:Cupin type-1 domain-containing protein n=1 Tax=Bionectria ochroleuca TaxID=29856 RepID=A0ABY6UXQ6_BIOOC|nr:unnamed protein product [Clonostachys rosea]